MHHYWLEGLPSYAIKICSKDCVTLNCIYIIHREKEEGRTLLHYEFRAITYQTKIICLVQPLGNWFNNLTFGLRVCRSISHSRIFRDWILKKKSQFSFNANLLPKSLMRAYWSPSLHTNSTSDCPSICDSVRNYAWFCNAMCLKNCLTSFV